MRPISDAWLYSACGHCEHCLGGWETLCRDQRNTGYSINGSYAEYVLADPDYVGHLPANVGFDEIVPILCAGVTVYKGIRMTDTRPGQRLAISGIGGLVMSQFSTRVRWVCTSRLSTSRRTNSHSLPNWVPH